MDHLVKTISNLSLLSGGDDSAYMNVPDEKVEEHAGPKVDLLQNKEALGLLAMLGSSFLFSIMALQVKCLSQFQTFELVFWRSVFMWLGTLGILAVKRISPLGPSGSRSILVLRGIAGFGFMSAFYYAIRTLPLSDAVVITYTSPVITGVAAALLLGEAWGKLDAIGSCLCLGGVMLISKPSFLMHMLGVTAPELPFGGTLAALASALLSSSVYVLLRYAKHLSPLVSVCYFAFVGLVLSPIFSFAEHEQWTWPEGLAWVQLVLLAVLSIAGQALMNVGLAFQTAGKATAMNYVQVVFAYLFQTLIFHNPSDALSIAGAALITSWGAIALIKEAGRRPAPSDAKSASVRAPSSSLRFPRLLAAEGCDEKYTTKVLSP